MALKKPSVWFNEMLQQKNLGNLNSIALWQSLDRGLEVSMKFVFVCHASRAAFKFAIKLLQLDSAH